MLSSKGIDILLFTTGSVAEALHTYKDNVLEKLEAQIHREKTHQLFKKRKTRDKED